MFVVFPFATALLLHAGFGFGVGHSVVVGILPTNKNDQAGQALSFLGDMLVALRRRAVRPVPAMAGGRGCWRSQPRDPLALIF
jgi:hypothetical protein